MAAFRVCTAEPLPVALFVGRGAWQVATGMLKTYGDTPTDRVLVLRSTGCAAKDPYPNIESWVIPAGATIPPYDDGVRLGDIVVVDLWHDGQRTHGAFRSLMRDALVRLRGDTDLALVVRGYYWGRPTTRMRASLTWALAQVDSILSNRVFVRQMPALNLRWAATGNQRLYPDVYLVSIKDTIRSHPAATPN